MEKLKTLIFSERVGTTGILIEQFSKLKNLVDILPTTFTKARYDRVIEILDELDKEIKNLKDRVETERRQ